MTGEYHCRINTGEESSVQLTVTDQIRSVSEVRRSNWKQDKCPRDEDTQELPTPNTERPEVTVREMEMDNMITSTSQVGWNTGNLDPENEENEEEEDVLTRADLAKIVSSHMQTIFRQLSDIDQRLNHIENQWNMKNNEK